MQENQVFTEELTNQNVRPAQQKTYTPFFLVGFALLAFSLLGLIIWQQNQQIVALTKMLSATEIGTTTEVKTTTESSPSVQDTQSKELLVHTNTLFGFRVAYPKEYLVVDQLQLDNREWKPNKDLSFTHTSSDQNVRILVRLDYDGYGPQFPLEIWKVSIDGNTRKLSVSSKDVQDINFIEEATGQPVSGVFIVTDPERTLFADAERSISFMLSYEGEKNQEIEADFEALIESFELLR